MKKIYVILAVVVFLSSCAKNKSDYNIDQKNATEVPASTLFTAAQKSLTDILTTPNVNSNVFRFYVQYWTATDYLDEPRYNLTARTIPQAFWSAMYKDVIADLRESKRIIAADKLITAEVADNQTAEAEILEVMAWSCLINTFGNVPYTEAMNIANVQPKYDDAATIYSDLLVRLDAAIGKLKPGAAGYGSADLVYKGDAGKWIKFGNSLKLRLGLILADKDPAKAKTVIETAALNVLSSAADNASYPYPAAPPNNNPIATAANPSLTGRKDFVGTQAFVNKLNDLNDPRRAGFFTSKEGQFIGGYYGFFNSYSNYSTMAARVSALDFEALLMDYPETEFALAEASARGFNVPGTAQEHYNNAVTASIIYWGGSETDASTYLARPDVAYLTASADFKEVIGIQKWIALYNRGYESWTEWRRLDFPRLDPPSADNAPEGQSVPAGLTIPVRIIYPINEQTLNGANRSEASAAIGGDLVKTKLFWDVK